jgi:hypothetical protein
VVGALVGLVVGLVDGAGVLHGWKSTPSKNSVVGSHLHPVIGEAVLLKQNLEVGLNPLSGFPVKQMVSCSVTEYPDSQKSKHSGKHASVGSNTGNTKEGALVGAAVVGASVKGQGTPSRVTLSPNASLHLHSLPNALSHSQKGKGVKMWFGYASHIVSPSISVSVV